MATDSRGALLRMTVLLAINDLLCIEFIGTLASQKSWDAYEGCVPMTVE